MSKVEDEVCELIQARAKKASIVKKYEGKTMVRDDLNHDEWLEHLQHELLDGAIYIQRLRTREQTLEAKLRELMDRWFAIGTSKTDLKSAAIGIKMLLDEVSE